MHGHMICNVKSRTKIIYFLLNLNYGIGIKYIYFHLFQVITTPEVVRVYIGSFWDQPFLYDDNRHLFEAERNDLFEDIQSLPQNAALRKLNDLIKRARLAKVS